MANCFAFSIRYQPPYMLIAVISDTHDVYPDRLTKLIKEADEVWHLGDVMSPNVLSELYAMDMPMHVVLGNCDYHASWPHLLNLEVEGVRCHLVHIPPPRSPPGTKILLHGHTHIPRDYTDHLGCHWLNPGSVSSPRGGFPASFGWLEIKNKQILRWDITRV